MVQKTAYTSAIGWIDFSSEHREKVKGVLDLLNGPGVVDEMGIGTIRDSFSDTLFPGISTIQTRAKYFLTIPRIFQDYKKLNLAERRRSSLADYLKDKENACMDSLNHNHLNDPQYGIIGATFAGTQGEVQRKPSSVYWNGLRVFGLIKTRLSLQEFSRTFANPNTPLQDLIIGTYDSKGDDADALESSGPVINTPPYADDWLDHLNLHLTFEEATFLTSQIGARVPQSLLGQILLNNNLRRIFIEQSTLASLCEEPAFIEALGKELQRTLLGARDFWQLLEGAHIRYNILLQKRHGTETKRLEFETRWIEWTNCMAHFPWHSWDTERLWQLAHQQNHQIQGFTKRFVCEWIQTVQQAMQGLAEGSTQGLMKSATWDLEALDTLVINQECANKKSRARLKLSADEQISKWIGIDALDYRYTQAQTIVKDIDRGLSQHEKFNA